MCTLKLSNVLMYEFHYDYINNKYGNSSRPLFADTDSLMYAIKTEDFNKVRGDKEMSDFSNYSTKATFYDNSKKLVVGKIEDETAVFRLKSLSD